MGQVTSQLSLPVGLKGTESFASFITGQNDQVCSHLNGLITQLENNQFAQWLTYLFADPGFGKSHLLYAVCQQIEQTRESSFYLSFNAIQDLTPDVLLGLEQYRLICLDDINKLQGNHTWQVAVFDLINRVKEQQNSYLVITGNQAPKFLSLDLPDLISRLNWGVNFKVHALTDEQRQQALIIKAQQRGLNMPKDVAKYLVTHWQRDMPALVASLDILDEKSLQQQRKLTIPFVKSILNL